MSYGSVPVSRAPVRLLLSLFGCFAAVVLVAACGGVSTTGGTSAQPAGHGATPAAAPVGQSVLPFEGLNVPNGVAVDTAGNVYLADRQNQRVLKLPAGSTSQIVLPFPVSSVAESGWYQATGGSDGLREPTAVAVDKAGNLYVGECGTAYGRVWKLAAGSATPIVLIEGESVARSFGKFGLAVDTAGNLYGSEAGNGSTIPAYLWKLTAPTTPNTAPIVLPVTGLRFPLSVALDSEGALYVVDTAWAQLAGDHRVVKISADLAAQTVLPLTGLDHPNGVAVDSTGTVYVTDGNVPDKDKAAHPGVSSRVLKLVSGSSSQTVLPFTDLHNANYLAVRPIWMAGPTDSVYVSDTLNNRVLRMGLGATP